MDRNKPKKIGIENIIFISVGVLVLLFVATLVVFHFINSKPQAGDNGDLNTGVTAVTVDGGSVGDNQTADPSNTGDSDSSVTGSNNSVGGDNSSISDNGSSNSSGGSSSDNTVGGIASSSDNSDSGSSNSSGGSSSENSVGGNSNNGNGNSNNSGGNSNKPASTTKPVGGNSNKPASTTTKPVNGNSNKPTTTTKPVNSAPGATAEQYRKKLVSYYSAKNNSSECEVNYSGSNQDEYNFLVYITENSAGNDDDDFSSGSFFYASVSVNKKTGVCTEKDLKNNTKTFRLN